MRIDTAANATRLVQVFSNVGEECIDIWSLNSVIKDDYLNYLYTSVNVTSGDEFHGIMGISHHNHETSDMFLDDGRYSLWSRDSEIKTAA